MRRLFRSLKIGNQLKGNILSTYLILNTFQMYISYLKLSSIPVQLYSSIQINNSITFSDPLQIRKRKKHEMSLNSHTLHSYVIYSLNCRHTILKLLSFFILNRTTENVLWHNFIPFLQKLMFVCVKEIWSLKAVFYTLCLPDS